MKPFDILVAGEINPDLILSGDVIPAFDQTEKLVDSAALTIGSSSAIFACGAARLGLKVAFVGVCGDDLFGHFMLSELEKRGVNVSNVIVRADGQTGLSVILNQGADRAILTHPGLIAALQASDISDGLLTEGPAFARCLVLLTNTTAAGFARSLSPCPGAWRNDFSRSEL